MSIDFLSIAKNHSTPLYVYDFDAIQSRLRQLRSLFGENIQLYYAVKANSNLKLLTYMRRFIDGLDISSAGEMKQALLASYQTDQLSFAGPGKTTQELEFAVKNDCGSINVESIDEIKALITITEQLNCKVNIFLRINPAQLTPQFAIKMGGKATQFGIEEENIEQAISLISQHNHLFNFIGYHIYAGTQCLDPQGLLDNIAYTLNLVQRLVSQHSLKPHKLNLGGGFGLPYFENDHELDIKEVAQNINSMLRTFEKINSLNLTYVLELGRYIVGEFGYYLTKILATKESRGKTYCIVDGGMHQNMSAGGNFGQIIRKNYKIRNLSHCSEPMKKVDLAGCLCTTLDTLATNIYINSPKVGDVLLFENSGAYGFTASPLLFLGHETPKEILIREGQMEIIRSSKQLTDFN
ncbi:hypothetical protein [Candidatus Nitrospira neomarina]|uniref:Pyridoxal-dependent decarboxylase, exosortase A system-associated n=1 Tax=Candidatus Nitrospira neomarina TaxID=3020899 RepID=A0AA96JXL0_9BACT|nr:hypothetical protein [Candidatus Nitrospira neomarina]WNM64017.1 pyridoxal-dependent decarboxylase, exosortase A system-associated [Candidatus Nitrospira neomarina]